MSNADDLEDLLQQARNEHEKINYDKLDKTEIKNKEFTSKLLKADKAATMNDFITMVDKIVTKTLSEYKVEFMPDEGKIVYLSNDEKLDHPVITYKLLDRKPKGELKPRIRESFCEEANGDSRVGEIYGQKFKCHIEFNVFASEYKMCNKIVDKFEDITVSPENILELDKICKSYTKKFEQISIFD